MFEYHGNNLTVDADGVSVTVALAEPLDIEKPLANLDLTEAEVKATEQSIADEEDMDGLRSDFEENDDWEEWDNWGWRDTVRDGYHANGWAVGFYGNEDHQPYYPGSGGEEVLARAIPFLELGVKGLLAFCSQEGRTLREWREQARARGEELTKAHEEAVQEAAEELERIMPKRGPAIAFEELKEFGRQYSLDIESEEDADKLSLWKKINGREIHIFWTSEEIGPWGDDPEWPGKYEGIRAMEDDDSIPNMRSGEVTISERGYFSAAQRYLSFDGRGHAHVMRDYATPQEAMEALAKWVAEDDSEPAD